MTDGVVFISEKTLLEDDLMKSIIVGLMLAIALPFLLGCVSADMPADSVVSLIEGGIVDLPGDRPRFPGAYPDDLPTLEGVYLTTEHEFYAEGTQLILAFWENSTDYTLMFGQMWQLEMYAPDESEWVAVHFREQAGFTLEGLILQPGMRIRHTYHASMFEGSLTEGVYRIRTSYSNTGIEGEGRVPGSRYEQHGISAVFTVTRDLSLHRRSELDYSRDENSTNVAIHNYEWFERRAEFPVRVYKDTITYDTTVVINGHEYYEIAAGVGGWGVVMCSYYAHDESKYLIYSYSRAGVDHAKLSYFGIFDLISREVIFTSEAFDNYYDISIIYYHEEDVFNVSFIEYWEFEQGGLSSATAPGHAGFLKYENGEFRLHRDAVLVSFLEDSRTVGGVLCDDESSRIIRGIVASLAFNHPQAGFQADLWLRFHGEEYLMCSTTGSIMHAYGGRGRSALTMEELYTIMSLLSGS